MKRRFDPASAIAGLLIGGLGVVEWLDQSGRLTLDPGWVLPIVLLAIGVVLLTLATAGRR